MKKLIFLFIILSIICFLGCNDNKVSAEFTEKRVIWNNSEYDIQIKMFFETEELNLAIPVNDSLVLYAYCEVRGGDRICFNPDYSSAFSSALEDSTQIIFNKERILRYNRENIGSCCTRNILFKEAAWGYTVEGSYTVEGKGTGIRTYTYEIINEDYENAEECNGDCG